MYLVVLKWVKMITENIIVALITGILSVIGSVASNIVLIKNKSKQDAIKAAERETRQSMRLDSIEKKLDIHNGYAEKFGDIQKDIAVVKKDIEYLRKEKK